MLYVSWAQGFIARLVAHSLRGPLVLGFVSDDLAARRMALVVGVDRIL